MDSLSLLITARQNKPKIPADNENTENKVIVEGIGVPTFTGCSGNGEPSSWGPKRFSYYNVIGPSAGKIQSLGSFVGTYDLC